jgi:hypothetical protein
MLFILNVIILSIVLIKGLGDSDTHTKACANIDTQSECSTRIKDCVWWETQGVCIAGRASLIREECDKTPTSLPGHHNFTFDIVIMWVNRTSMFGCEYEIKYTLRSIEDNGLLPWVRKIFVVYSDVHIYSGIPVDPPVYLRTDHPQLEFIPQTEIFIHSENTPAVTREQAYSGLHRIPGLSEFYMVFADDDFIGRPFDWNDWWDFSRKRLRYHVFHSRCLLDWYQDASYFIRFWNAGRLLQGVFGDRCREIGDHYPAFYRKCVVSYLTDVLFSREALETERNNPDKKSILHSQYNMRALGPNAAVDAGYSKNEYIGQRHQMIFGRIAIREGSYAEDGTFHSPVFDAIQPGFAMSWNAQSTGIAGENTGAEHQAIHDAFMSRLETMYPRPSRFEIDTLAPPPQYSSDTWGEWCRSSPHWGTWQT